MGFIYRKGYVLGGSDEFPSSGTTNEDLRHRAEVLIKKCAKSLIDCGCGWQLDTNRCSNFEDFINIPNANSIPGQFGAPGLLFTNEISGCKALMFYEPNNVGTKLYNGALFAYNNTTYHSGLCISIIPPGSDSEFGDPQDESFYPNDATRVCGTYYATGSRASESPAAYRPNPGTYYWYYILASCDCIAVYLGRTQTAEAGWPLIPVYATGKIFSKLMHEEDTSPQAKYGTIIFRQMTTSYECYARAVYNTVGGAFGSQNVFGCTGNYPGFNLICFTNVKGEWLNRYSSDSYNVYAPISWYTLGKYVNSNNVAWCGFIAMSVSPDLNNDGVTIGNGVKGILDTDYFRAISNAEIGTVLDNGKFLVPESNLGLAIGSDIRNHQITAYWGDEVTIPDGYTIDYITCNVAYSFATYKDVTDKITIVLSGKDQCSTVLGASMIQNYPPSKYPALEMFKGISIDNSATPKMQGIRLTRGSSGASPSFSVTRADVNNTSSEYGDYFIYLQGTTTSADVKNAVMSKYPFRLFLQTDSAGNVISQAFNVPTSLYRVTNNKISWLGDTSNEDDLAYYYANDWGGQILFNVYLKKV